MLEVKVLDRSRQWLKQHGKASAHHIIRYELATKLATGRVLDAACGTGYGTYMLGRDAVGVDSSLDAITWARTNFPGPTYYHARIEDSPWDGGFDTVVSFETIEHVTDPKRLLSALRKACRGEFIASVPNEERYPFRAENFANDESPHFRHYTPREFQELLEESGFRVVERFCQQSKREPQIVSGTDGIFMIYVCS